MIEYGVAFCAGLLVYHFLDRMDDYDYEKEIYNAGYNDGYNDGLDDGYVKRSFEEV